jgi:hypothetical protein
LLADYYGIFVPSLAWPYTSVLEAAMTFEEYAGDLMLEPNSRDWKLAHDAYYTGRTQALFEANNRAGDAGNEAEKDARRKVGVEETLELLYRYSNPRPSTVAAVDAIIRKAQG